MSGLTDWWSKETQGRSKLFLYVPMAISLLLIFIAGAACLADIISTTARSRMYEWERHGGIGDARSWDGAVAGMEKASRLDPLNASLITDLGRLHEWKALQYTDSEEARPYRENAIEYYRKALAISPARSFVWAHLAQSKMFNLEFDDEAVLALEKAMILGPWEPGTQRKVIWVGIAAWPHLPDGQRLLLIESVKRGLKNKRLGAFAIGSAVRFGWEKNLEPLLMEEWQKNALHTALKKYGKGVK